MGRECRSLVYAAGNFSKNILSSTADITLLFVLTELLAVPAAMAGWLILVSLVVNAVCDLLVGAQVNRMDSRWGQAGPFILLGAPACIGAFILIYSLPLAGEVGIGVIAACVIGFRALYACIDVPHNALITKVRTDSRGRGRVAGYRFLFSTLASLVIAATMAPALIGGDASVTAGRLLPLAACFGALALGLILLAWWVVRGQDRRQGPVGRAALLPAWDPLFLHLAAIALLTGATAPLFSNASLFYADYALPFPMTAASLLAAVAVGQVPGILLWTLLVNRVEKRALLAAAHLTAALGFATAGLAGPLHPWMPQVAALLIGMGLSGIYSLPWALAADIVDIGEYRSGKRREASSFALLVVLMKLGIGLAGATIGWTLSAAGYVPDAPRSPEMRWWLTLTACGLPASGSLVCALLAAALPVTHRNHAAVAARLHRRHV